MYIYLIANNDKYELPVFLGTASECAKYFNESLNDFTSASTRCVQGKIIHHRHKKLYRWKEKELDND